MANPTIAKMLRMNATFLRIGFIPALLVLIVGSALAGKEFRLIEVLLLAIGLTAFSVALFIWGLGLPYPLLVGW